MAVVSFPLKGRAGRQRRRKPEIIEAAARVFAERGFHGTTTQDIADVLGIRQASLYYYFPSKEAAFEQVCLKGVEDFFEAARLIANSPGTARERLSLLINSHLSPLIDRGDFVKVFLNERQHLPTESRRRVGRWSRGLERIYEDVIREGIASGEFRADLNPRVTTLAVLGMCNAAASWYRRENVGISLLSVEFARLIVDGLGKRGKAQLPRAGRPRRGPDR